MAKAEDRVRDVGGDRVGELQQELNRRIPRGARGSDQNLFRAAVWFWRRGGQTFDDSIARALRDVRVHAPEFVARIVRAPFDGGD